MLDSLCPIRLPNSNVTFAHHVGQVKLSHVLMLQHVYLLPMLNLLSVNKLLSGVSITFFACHCIL